MMRGPRQTEDWKLSQDKADAPNPINTGHRPEDYVWATGDQARLRVAHT